MNTMTMCYKYLNETSLLLQEYDKSGQRIEKSEKKEVKSMENQILASCPAGYSEQGNVVGNWFCNGEWCSPLDPFSPRQHVRHVYIRCVRSSDGDTKDVYAYSEIECTCSD